MTSKDSMLEAIRRQPVPPAPLPDLAIEGIRFDDAAAHFAESLSIVGGKCVPVAGRDEILSRGGEIPCELEGAKICSLVEGVLESNVELAALDDPHDLENVDVAVVEAEFGVAENGAVWISGAHLKHQALLFITQHLVVVLDERQIVSNLHEAYERLSWEGAGFGVFVSGPSKTADIEQSLVIGAHGPRSLTAFLVGA